MTLLTNPPFILVLSDEDRLKSSDTILIASMPVGRGFSISIFLTSRCIVVPSDSKKLSSPVVKATERDVLDVCKDADKGMCQYTYELWFAHAALSSVLLLVGLLWSGRTWVRKSVSAQV